MGKGGPPGIGEALRQSRTVPGVLLLVHLGLSATPQATDLLIALGQDGSAAAWAGLLGGTGWLAANAWFWSRFALRSGGALAGRAAAVPGLLAAASFLLVADVLRTAAAAVPDGMENGGAGRLLGAAAAVGLAGLCAAAVAWRPALLRPAPAGGLRAVRRMVGLSVAAGTAGLAGFAFDPVMAAAVLPPAAIVLLAAAGVMCGGTLLLHAGRRSGVPVLFLALLLALGLAALRDRGLLPDNHALRQLPAGLPARPDVEEAFLQFLDAARPADGQPTPVVLVAASGGGIAAAFWTATVLGDLHDASPAFAGQVFAASGVSGGALGLLAYAAGAEAGCPAGSVRRCLQQALGGEFLGPALGAALYPDLLQRFLPAPVFADRAAALEAAWEARWREVSGNARLGGPFLGLWRPGRPWPALLLNATSRNSGGRLVVSNLQLGRDHVGGNGADLLHQLGADVPASAAAGASARFPFISPFGTFRGDGGARDAVADGGYFENLGASTLLELLDALDAVARRHDRPVRFIVVQLVNDPGAGPGGLTDAAGTNPEKSPETPWSLLPEGLTGPAAVLLRTRDARGVSASEALARRVLGLGGAYVPVRLGRSPNGRTAPLGWSLSATARAVIDSQWTAPCRDSLLAAAGAVAPLAADLPRMDVMAMWASGTCRALPDGAGLPEP